MPRNILDELNKEPPTVQSVVKLVPVPVTVELVFVIEMVPGLFTVIVTVPVFATDEVTVPACTVPKLTPTVTFGVNVTRLLADVFPLASKATLASALSELLLTLTAKPV